MTPKHTPEPWDHMPPIGEGLDAVLAKQVTSFGNFYVAQCNVAADAARIVACVNACAGLNPEAIPALIKALDDAAARLAAVGGLLHAYPRMSGDLNGRMILDAYEMSKASSREAYAALAAVKGTK